MHIFFEYMLTQLISKKKRFSDLEIAIHDILDM